MFLEKFYFVASPFSTCLPASTLEPCDILMVSLLKVPDGSSLSIFALWQVAKPRTPCGVQVAHLLGGLVQAGNAAYEERVWFGIDSIERMCTLDSAI